MRYLFPLPALLMLALAFPVGVLPREGASEHLRPSILFVTIDDLNAFPGDRYADVDTPNLDRVAATGVSFTNAHAVVPICNPSRVALITGIGPTTSGIIANTQTDFRTESAALATVDTLFKTFQDDGYTIDGTGKVFHEWAVAADYDNTSTPWDSYIDNDGKEVPDPLGANGLNGIVGTDPNSDLIFIRAGDRLALDWGPIETPSDPDETALTSDWKRADWAAAKIAELESQDAPGMVVLGLFKPHLPWFCPEAYFDALTGPVTTPPGITSGDRSDIDNPDDPLAFRADWLDLDAADVVNDAQRGYMVCVEFADAMLGIALDAIDASNKPWIVVVTGDHGYQLGEKDTWAKLGPWDIATRTTFIIGGAGFADGTTNTDPVSLVDIYPTLCDYANVPCPSGLEGISLRSRSDQPIRVLNSSDGSTVTSTVYISRRWTYIVGAVTTEFYDKDADSHQYANLDYPSVDSQYDDVKTWLALNARP